ncbi:MAG: CDP-diacylglycerol--glycerol-3-phosphate 3-phosphatidyltransferase, partial [Candidatus Electrothrix sp. ATG2]|nr:CDP-diacylglycerol--glycerol-3-phosphate 3-phosphatidyltransferase [Candidatus Electrothrix sp. ATG2]
WFDGYLARRFKAVTTLGKLMDPLADKLLVATALIMLIPLNRLPAWVALVILSREMMVTGLRGLASSSGIVVSASGLGKVKSTLQYIGLGTLIFPLGLLPIPYLHHIGLAVVYVALVLTVWSGVDYFYKLRQVFLMKEGGM